MTGKPDIYCLTEDDVVERVRQQANRQSDVPLRSYPSHQSIPPFRPHSMSLEQWNAFKAQWHAERDVEPPALDLTPGQTRVSWDDWAFGIARAVRLRSTCPRASIGVVLLDKDHRIVSVGYNGAPRGEIQCIDEGVGCWLYGTPDEPHCVRATHAEANAVDAAFQILSTALITDPRGFSREAPFLSALDITPYIVGPRSICSHCARLMAFAGIRREPKCRSE